MFYPNYVSMTYMNPKFIMNILLGQETSTRKNPKRKRNRGKAGEQRGKSRKRRTEEDAMRKIIPRVGGEVKAGR